MRLNLWMLAIVLLLPLSFPAWGEGQAPQRSKEQDNSEPAIGQVLGDLQNDLEASSSSGVLGKIDRDKFHDFDGFRDSVERLTREDTLRVYFRQLSNSVKGDQAQTVLDAEMEMTRKDSTRQAQQRKQQITIDFARTGRGWKIVNVTPRAFFEPL